MIDLLAAGPEAQNQILLTLLIMLAAAKLFAELFERLRQPAVVGEILAGVLIGRGLGWRRVGQVGMGMVPRGEVGIVVAQIGIAMAVISDSLYAVVLMIAVATTLIAPPFLRLLFASERTGSKTPIAEPVASQ